MFDLVDAALCANGPFRYYRSHRWLVGIDGMVADVAGERRGLMSNSPIPLRALTDLETNVVTKLLSSNAPGASEYLAQVPYSKVVATWGVGSPSVDLAVRPGAVQACGSTDGIFAIGAVTDRNGSPIGEVILWVENGWLSGVEYAWYTNERPHTLPEPDQIALL
ncbi:hypothetical protein [Nocardia beijingensis]